MRKVLDIISVVSFLLVAALTGGTVFGYFWITNEENQEKIKKQVIDSVMSNVPIPGGLTDQHYQQKLLVKDRQET